MNSNMKSTSMIGGVLGFTLMAFTGFASAQSTGTFTINNQGSATAPAAGASGATMGTMLITATQSGQAGNVSVISLPLTLTTGAGAQGSNLSACQVFGPNGNPINTGSNILANPVNGSNTIMFDSPLQINGGSSLMLTVRCNIASGTSAGGTFQFTGRAPAQAQIFGVRLNPAPVVRPAAEDTLLAVITFSNSPGSSVQVSSLPVNASFAQGASSSSLSDCRVRNVANLSTALNSGAVSALDGVNTFTLDTPLIIGAGSTVSLALTCDVSAGAPSGGTILLSVMPGNLLVSVVGNGTPVTASTGFTSNGILGPTSGSVLISSATVPLPTTSGPIIPGAPNTGIGGDASLTVLFASAIGLFFGILLLRRRSL